MSRYQIPVSKQPDPVVIQQFRGVDFSADSTQVDPSRSPDALTRPSSRSSAPAISGWPRAAGGSGGSIA